MSEIDRAMMGTQEKAEADLIMLAREWRKLRQPIMATRAELRKRENLEHETRFQLANAVLHWLWHKENPAM